MIHAIPNKLHNVVHEPVPRDLTSVEPKAHESPVSDQIRPSLFDLMTRTASERPFGPKTAAPPSPVRQLLRNLACPRMQPATSSHVHTHIHSQSDTLTRIVLKSTIAHGRVGGPQSVTQQASA